MSESEVFRFVSLRNVQNCPAEKLAAILIKPLVHSDVHMEMRDQPEEQLRTLEEARSSALQLLDSELYLADPDTISTPIRAVSDYLAATDNRPVIAELVSKIESLSGTDLKSLVASSQYFSDRQNVYVNLLALTLAPQGRERLRGRLLRAMYVFGLIERLALQPALLQTSIQISEFMINAVVVLPRFLNIPGDALSRQPYIADLKVVRQKLLRYEVGEIAHIENILKRENKQRRHSRKDLTEDIVVTESEREVSQDNELETTERFELQKESSTVIKEDMHLDAGLSVTASYGPVSATASAGFEMNNSREESNSTAQTFARDVTERSSHRVREKVKTARTTRSLKEIRETNIHGIDNSQGTSHVIGIYRYVDKVYQAQLYNYGKRLMLEFIVPEPAAFVSQLLGVAPKVQMEEPKIPMMGIGTAGLSRPLEPTDITAANYLTWAARYAVQGIKPPPADTLWLSFKMEETAKPDTGITVSTPGRKIYKATESTAVPQGYKADRVKGIAAVTDWQSSILFHTGGTQITLTQISGQPGRYGFDQALAEAGSTTLPIGLFVENTWGYEITLLIRCTLTETARKTWQYEAYSQIMQAYYELKAMYEEQITAAQIKAGVKIEGRNPSENRMIEFTELKKHVITMLQEHDFNQPPVNDESIIQPQFGQYPRINFNVAKKERDYIQWFEQAFEWGNMTYVFYPYYWKRTYDWKFDVFSNDPDPLFSKFLQAGAARVVVPVRPGFERAMSLYLSMGILWNGSQVPQCGDPLFISAVQEIQEQLSAPDNGVAEGNPWPVTLPTPLVILQEDGILRP